MAEHKLQLDKVSFEAVKNGFEKCKVRFNDRNFAVGDRLILCEFCPVRKRLTGREIIKVVSHIVEGGSYEIEEGYVVLSF